VVSKVWGAPSSGKGKEEREIFWKSYISKLNRLQSSTLLLFNSFLGFPHRVFVGDIADVSELHSMVEVLDWGSGMVIVASPRQVRNSGQPTLLRKLTNPHTSIFKNEVAYVFEISATPREQNN
jgi:hypothetical protein